MRPSLPQRSCHDDSSSLNGIIHASEATMGDSHRVSTSVVDAQGHPLVWTITKLSCSIVQISFTSAVQTDRRPMDQRRVKRDIRTTSTRCGSVHVDASSRKGDAFLCRGIHVPHSSIRKEIREVKADRTNRCNDGRSRSYMAVCQGSLEAGPLSDWLFGNMIWPDTHHSRCRASSD